ncbi:MAG: hypothetical protein J6D46_05960, partial [Lachnospiraceae bacterium]|nr:hypothetical protein [Lachnospiraceae bacterium]
LRLHRSRRNSGVFRDILTDNSIRLKRALLCIAAAAVLTGCAASPSAEEGSTAAVSEAGPQAGGEEGTQAGSEEGTQAASEGKSAGHVGSDPATGAEESGAQPEAGAAQEEETVTVVIPTVYEEVKTQEEADRIREKNGYKSVTLEENGSLTIVMTKSQHDELIRDFRTSVDKGISEIIGAGGGSSIEKIEYNEDYSIFTVTVTEEEIGVIERQAADELIMYGALYHVYTGNDADRIRVDYVNAQSGEVIETADSGSLESAY